MTPKNPYDNIYGTWLVTTEGDCEGRTTENLGVFTGCVDVIALHLAHYAEYSLTFTAVDTVTAYKITKKEVHVKFNIESGTWDCKDADLISTMQDMFKDRPVRIKRSSHFASFCITTDLKTDDEIKQEKLDKIKSKLTADEIALLEI